MKVKHLLLVLVFLGTCLSGGAQDVARLLRENPDRAANNMHSYEFAPVEDTRAPKGYTPVYISHYGRHGSRHDVSSSTSDQTLALFRKADSLGQLTVKGKELMEAVRIMAEEHDGMGGALSPRGGREHEQLAIRMADRFPSVFGKGKRVSAVSSTAERCIVSMGYFMSSLKSRFPDVNMEMTTGERFAPVIRLTSGTSANMQVMDAPRGGNRGNGGRGGNGGNGGGNMRPPQQNTLPEDYSTFLGKIFVDPKAVQNPDEVVRNVFKLGGLCQDLDFLGLDIFRFFTPEELLSLWQQNNDEIYGRWGNSIENGYAKALTAQPLMDDIIDKADAALKNGKTAADLRFGHDMSLMALWSLMGIDADGGERYRSAEAHEKWYAFQIVPTAANLQLVFYTAPGKDVLVKVLRNEQEVSVKGLEPVSGPYYRWEDFKAKFSAQEQYDLTFDKEDFIVLKTRIPTAKGPVDVTYKAYMHIPYVARPLDPAYQSLCIFEPIFINGKGWDASSAPILFSNRVNGYLSVDDSQTADVKEGRESLALAAGMVVVVPGCRGRTLQDSEGTYIGKAPAAVVDLKAAIRYLRHNKALIPGDTEKIVSVGCSAGGAISAVVGASGNSPLFESRLVAIGAAQERDDVFATGAFSPIMDLAHADMAYEWEFGTSPWHGQTVDQMVSSELGRQFIAYQETLPVRAGAFGHLTADKLGDYMSQEWLNPSATLFLNNLSDKERADYLQDKDWLGWDGERTHFTFDQYRAHTTPRVKGIPAFDSFDLKSPENNLFGNEKTDSRHFTDYSLQKATGDPSASIDPELQQVVDMMNPLYYVFGRNKGCSVHWWIRHGAAESGNSRASVITMAAELSGQGKHVNGALFWDANHCQDKDPEGFIDWILELTGPKDDVIREKLLDKNSREVLTGSIYGDWHGTMENSLHAIQKAVDKGADLASISIRKTADGRLICFSDDTVDRLLNGSGKVSELTLAQIRALAPKEYSGPSDWNAVPTLEEALAFAKGKILLHLDLNDLAEDILAVVKREGAEKQVVFKRKYPGEGFYYMPVFDVEHHEDLTELERLLALNPVGIEVHFTKDDAPLLQPALQMIRGRARIAMNTGGEKAGSHHDPKSGGSDTPDRVWGELISQGVSVIFTDGIKPLVRYLGKY